MKRLFVGLGIALFSCLAFATTVALAADITPFPEDVMEWTQVTQDVEDGAVWYDIAGWHYRNYVQTARYLGDCRADVTIVFNADISPDGQGVAYGTIQVTMATSGGSETPDESNVFKGAFEYILDKFRVVGGLVDATNISGTEQLLVTKVTQVRGTLLKPQLLLEGFMVCPDINPWAITW